MILDLELKYLIEIPSSDLNLIDLNNEGGKLRQNPPLTPRYTIQVNCGALLDDTFYCRKWTLSLCRNYISPASDFGEISECSGEAQLLWRWWRLLDEIKTFVVT